MCKKLRKFSSLTLSLILSMTMLTGIPSNGFNMGTSYSVASAEETTPESSFKFDSASQTITRYTGTETNVAIPSTIGGVEVKNIGKQAFFSNRTITSVKLNEGLETIGEGAFSGCNSLTNVEFSSTVKTIGKGAFIRVPATSIQLNDGLKQIGNMAFSTMGNLKSINLPSSLEVIDDNAFYNTKPLEGKFIFGENLGYVGHRMFFKDATNISVEISEKGKKIEFHDELFPTNITSLNIPQGREVLIFTRAFYNDGDKTLDSGTIDVNVGTTKEELAALLKEKIKLTSGFACINSTVPDHSLDKIIETDINWNLDSINLDTAGETRINGKFNEISEDAYNSVSCTQNKELISQNLAKLKPTVVINVVDNISNEWTQDSFTFGMNSSTVAPNGQYFGITGLSELGKKQLAKNKNLVIPSVVTVDENGNNVEKKVRGIGKSAFSNMGIESIQLPKITDGYKDFIIDTGAFSDNKISKIDFSEGIKAIDSQAFRNNKLTEVNIPSTVLRIGNEAFEGNLISNLDISDDVNLIQIDNFSFANNKLKSVDLPYSIFKIKEFVFKGNPGMEPVQNPDSEMGDENVGVVYLYTRNPIHLHTSTYIYSSKYQKFILKGDGINREKLYKTITTANNLYKDDYKEASWNEFSTVLKEAKAVFRNNESTEQSLAEMNSKLISAMGKLEAVDVNKKKLAEEVSRISALNPALYTEDSWSNVNTQLENTKSVLSKPDVTQIQIDKALNDLLDAEKKLAIAENMKWKTDDFKFDGTIVTGYSESGKEKAKVNKDLIIPETSPTGEKITEIGKSAFELKEGYILGNDVVTYSPGIKSVKIPKTVTKIGASAFRFNALTGVELPEGLTTIDSLAFNGNILKEVSIPDTVTSMGDGVFSLNSIEKAKLSKGMTVVPNGIFSRNITLKNIEIPEGVTVIKQAAFTGAPLTSIKIPSTVEVIERKAFSAHRMEKINIPGNVKKIEAYAFEENVKFRYTKELILGEGIESIDNAAFKSMLLKEVKIPKSLKVLHKNAFANNLDENKQEIVVKLITSNKDHVTMFEDSKYHVIVYKQDPVIEPEPIVKQTLFRVAGSNRFDTAVKLSSKYFNKSDEVVLVSSEKYTDSLVSSLLTKRLNSPILLSKKSTVDSKTIEEMKRLGAKKITIVGGENSIDAKVVNQLENNGFNVTRVGGKDRYDTASKISKLSLGGKESDEVYLIDGTNIYDGLSIANLSTKLDVPVLLTTPKKLPKNTLDYIKNNNIKKVTLIGGKNSISENVENELKGYTLRRIAGKDRYSTSLLVAKEAYSNAKNVLLASGLAPIDGLVSGAIVAKTQSPLVLMKKEKNDALSTWLKSLNVDSLGAIGGTSSINQMEFEGLLK